MIVNTKTPHASSKFVWTGSCFVLNFNGEGAAWIACFLTILLLPSAIKTEKFELSVSETGIEIKKLKLIVAETKSGKTTDAFPDR